MKKNNQVIRILNCIPSTKTEKDWLISNAIEANILTVASLPSAKDLRASWWKIGDQINTGSCVGWASTDGVLRWHLTKQNFILPTQLLSVRFPWMASKETDEFNERATTFIESAGTSLKGALDVARKYGAVNEEMLPFDGKLSIESENDFYAKAAKFKITSYFNLIEPNNKLSNFKNWIANHGPILTRLNVDSNWMNLGSNGLLKSYNKNTQQGGHAVAIVGYTPTHFIVRNSWGKSWGDNGFAYASYKYAEDAFTEAYGISI